MHPQLLIEVIKTCQQRQSEGDCPTIKSFSVEQLETAVCELAEKCKLAEEKRLDDAH